MDEFQAKIKACQYDTVYVIGNGFDISAGLKSSYGDFINSKQFKPFVPYYAGETPPIQIYHSSIPGKPIFKQEKENLLAKHLYDRYNENNGWVDAELELKYYLINNSDRDQQIIEDEYNEIVSCLSNYLTELIEKFSSEGVSFISEKAAYRFLQNQEFKSPSIALNFNYTPTFYNFAYRAIEANYAPHKALLVVNVHGKLKDKNIIFGVEDNNSTPDNFIFLLKSANKNYKIDPEFKLGGKSISKVLADAKNIIFFGYSLGETDHSYFLDFFDSNPEGYNITIYYYGEAARRDIVCRLRTLTKCKLVELFSKNTVNFKNVKPSE